MCRSISYKGKSAHNQGQLAKLLGDGDWKRGKELMVYAADDDIGFRFNDCLCCIRAVPTAANVGCVIEEDSIETHFVPALAGEGREEEG